MHSLCWRWPEVGPVAVVNPCRVAGVPGAGNRIRRPPDIADFASGAPGGGDPGGVRIPVSADAGQRGGDQVRATRAVRLATVVTGSATIASTSARLSATA
jgi:hypothetical protein